MTMMKIDRNMIRVSHGERKSSDWLILDLLLSFSFAPALKRENGWDEMNDNAKNYDDYAGV